MTTNHQKALAHISAVKAARDALGDLYRDPNRDARHVARLNSDLGDGLKLAEIHATLAVADELRLVQTTLIELFDSVADDLPVPFQPAVAGA